MPGLSGKGRARFATSRRNSADAPVIVFATLSMAGNILLESALSFLGVGIQPPTPSWGNMIQEGMGFYNVAWWITLFPGLAILLTVVSLNLVGNGLRDALSPGARDRSRM